jgi:2,3-dihydroxyphenylpropionate 1,2-dioxygenase
MSVALFCASHSPLMYCHARAPDCREASEQLFARHAATIGDFDPELVIVFGPDHFNGFHLRLMPPFCIGLRCEATSDIGGFAGKLQVPEDLAVACIESVRRADVDVAVSYQMTVDHGFSQTLFRILGSLDRYPTIPVFVNGIAPPFVPFRRSRLLGAAIGRFAAALGKRVLFVASGGMSHNPRRYYPDYGTGEQPVTDYQLHGGHGPGLTVSQWLERLDVMHREGAQMLVDGRRTAADLMLNPEFDRSFMEILSSGDLQRLDTIDPGATVAKAGIGSLELHTWVAAAAANAAAGGAAPVEDLYAEALEYGVAFGMMHAWNASGAAAVAAAPAS